MRAGIKMEQHQALVNVLANTEYKIKEAIASKITVGIMGMTIAKALGVNDMTLDQLGQLAVDTYTQSELLPVSHFFKKAEEKKLNWFKKIFKKGIKSR
jgi:hypothetical protein